VLPNETFSVGGESEIVFRPSSGNESSGAREVSSAAAESCLDPVLGSAGALSDCVSKEAGSCSVACCSEGNARGDVDWFTVQVVRKTASGELRTGRSSRKESHLLGASSLLPGLTRRKQAAGCVRSRRRSKLPSDRAHRSRAATGSADGGRAAAENGKD